MVKGLSLFAIVSLVAAQGTNSNAQEKGWEKKVVDVPAASKPALDRQAVPQLHLPQRVVAPPPRLQDRPKMSPSREPSVGVFRAPKQPVARPHDMVAAEQRQTMVVHVRHAAVQDVAETVERWASTGGKSQSPISVISSAGKSLLLVSGTPKQLTAVQGLVRELDQPLRQIRVRVVIAELTLDSGTPVSDSHAAADQPIPLKGDIDNVVAQLKQRGDVRILARPEITAQENVLSEIRLGARVPRITGASTTSRGTANTVTMENVGTLLSITGRVTDNQVVALKLNLEHSHMGPDDEGAMVATTGTGVAIRSPQIQTLELETSVSIPSGEIMVLGGMVCKAGHLWRKTVVLLQPDVR